MKNGKSALTFPAIQGVIDSYGNLKDGSEYMKLKYFIGEKEYSVKVLFKLSESAIPDNMKNKGKASKDEKTDFRKTFVDSVPLRPDKDANTVNNY